MESDRLFPRKPPEARGTPEDTAPQGSRASARDNDGQDTSHVWRRTSVFRAVRRHLSYNGDTAPGVPKAPGGHRGSGAQ